MYATYLRKTGKSIKTSLLINISTFNYKSVYHKKLFYYIIYLGAIMIWITGDTHRDFSRFDSFCRYNGTTKDDLMIVLGDAALNFSGEKSDKVMKYEVSRLPLTFLFIRGNLEERAENIESYKKKKMAWGEKY